MTLAKLEPVSCPNCGSGLKVLGGGRVVVQVCGYCGTQLDTIENYRALRTFANLKRPDTPFSIGMTGQVLGVGWTIIGILGLREADGGVSWTWVDHLIYSPTHGYGWLTLEDGHLILTRRYRGAVSPGWMSVQGVEVAEKPPVVRAEGGSYKYYETSTAMVSFAEGEFTWRVGVGDKSVTVSALSGDAMLGFAQSGTEHEIERSTYLPQVETWASFGLPPATPYKLHPLQPYQAGPNAGFLLWLGGIGAAICLAMTLVFAGMSGTVTVPNQTIARAALPMEVTVPVTSATGLTTISLSADVDNAWAFIEATLTDPEGKPVFAAGREVDFYHGYEEGYWSEGSASTDIVFHPEVAGDYTLELDVPEGGRGEDTGLAPISTLHVSAQSGGSSPLWTLIAALAFAGIAGFQLAGAMRHEKARWSGTDWTDDDDGGDDD